MKLNVKLSNLDVQYGVFIVLLTLFNLNENYNSKCLNIINKMYIIVKLIAFILYLNQKLFFCIILFLHNKIEEDLYE